MFTSFIQYMFLLPSCESLPFPSKLPVAEPGFTDVNILMMYAMCNLHDVTWGTKGDNGSTKDLGGATKVQGKDGKEMMAVNLPTMQEDVDALWTASKNSLKYPPPPQKESRDAATKQADNDRNSRTNVVLAWVGTNMIMITAFTSSAFLSWVNDNVGVQKEVSSTPT
jgi:chitin synthase